MMSARRWKECQALWPALVFWAWLASFIFGFAASDLLHTPNCPEQLTLRAASNDIASGVTALQASGATALQASAWHALHVDTACPTCLLEERALGVVALALMWAVPLPGAHIFALRRAARAIARPQICSARGPPVALVR